MVFINCKVEHKLKWTNHCVLFRSGADNINNRDSNNIIFTIKGSKLYASEVTSSEKDNQKLSRRLSKGFKRSVYLNEYKTKSNNRNTANKFRYFLQSNFVGVNTFLF